MTALGPRADLVGLIANPALADEGAPILLRRSDGRALLYPEAVNLICGPPGCGKTWLALQAVVEVAEADCRAVILDYESTPSLIAGRLRALGLDATDAERVHYHPVAGSLDPEDRARLTAAVEALNPALIVIDSVAESLAAQGCDENSASEVARWFADLVRPLARQGPALLLLDHVVKDLDSRGRWARGSGHKLAMIDGAGYGLEVDVPWHRGGSGHACLAILKDRAGHVGGHGAIAADAVVSVLDGGERVLVCIDPPADDMDGPKASNPAIRMSPRDVVECLIRSGGSWCSRSEAATVLGLSGDATRSALDRAVAAGVIQERRDGNRIRYELPGPDRLDREFRALPGIGGEAGP